MSWQKCPICNGSGIDPNTNGSNIVPVCNVCEGKRIISEINGLPPASQLPSIDMKRQPWIQPCDITSYSEGDIDKLLTEVREEKHKRMQKEAAEKYFKKVNSKEVTTVSPIGTHNNLTENVSNIPREEPQVPES